VVRILALAASQARYVNTGFWRNPARAFFTFVFPLMFLVIFTALLGNDPITIGSVTVDQSTYYVAAMATFGVISACYSNIAMATPFQRDTGQLKQIHATPLPSSSFLIGRLVHAMAVGVLLVVITAVFGRIAYDASIPTGTTLLEVTVMLVVGAASFCALGLAMSAAVPNADAAPAIVNASILPLLFLSGIFIPFGNETPEWIRWVGRVFPVQHFAAGMQAAFLGTPFHWYDVLVVALWGVVGLVLGLRFFSWEPRT
jgi:ABC-2 type transport system permease protein